MYAFSLPSLIFSCFQLNLSNRTHFPLFYPRFLEGCFRGGHSLTFSMIFQTFLLVMVITTLPRRNADSDASEAAGLVWGHLARHVVDPNATAAKLSRALVPVYGVTWNRAVITSTAVGGTTEINRVCCLLRNSNLARSEYGRLVAFVLEAYSYSSLFPPEMSEWRELAHRHRLEMHFPWGQLLAISLSSAGLRRLPPAFKLG